MALLFVGLVVLLVSLFLVIDYRMEKQRAEWKTTTLAQLSSAEITDPLVQSELVSLTGDSTNNSFSWAGQRVIKLTNGEFLVYAFWHGQNAGFVDHLFLAHGSDGQWYYSSYHFCQQLTGIRFFPRPLSIADFADKYALREFDGKSDVCLQRTHTGSEVDEITAPQPPDP